MKTSRDEQSELICAALAGDQDAYATLHARYKPMVMKAVRSFSRDADDLEDLMQDAFLRIFEKLSSFQGDADFGTWCYRVAYNVALMKLRNPETKIKAASFSIDDKQDDGENEAKWEPSGEAIEYEFVGDVDKLRAAIKEMPHGYRSIIEARMEGVEYRQIAKELGIHIGTAKSQTIRATEKLRVALTKGKPMFTTEYEVPTESITNTPTTPVATKLGRKCKCGCGEGIPDKGWPYKTGHTPAGVRAAKNTGLALARKDNPASRVIVREVASKPSVTIPLPEKSTAVTKLGIIIAAQRGDLAEVVKLVGAL